jgi:hypothetical protein
MEVFLALYTSPCAIFSILDFPLLTLPWILQHSHERRGESEEAAFRLCSPSPLVGEGAGGRGVVSQNCLLKN